MNLKIDISYPYQIEDELFFTRDWLKSHVSDHSAVNHRIQVINQILLNAELLSHVSNPLVPGDGPEAEAEAEAETAHTEGNNLTQQLRFLASMFMHSAEVITTRPGHEALWCLRRSLLEILFQTIQNQVLTFCGFGLKQLLMGTKIPRTSLHLEISAQVKNEADGVLVGVHSFDALDKAVKGLDRPGDQLPSPNLSRSLSTHPIIGAKSRAPIIAWLASFLAEEMRLGGVCAQDAAAWDYEAQRLMALRYVAFLLDRTTHYFVADADVDIVASQGASTDGNYDGDCKCSCDCDHSTDIDITGGSLVEQREVASGVASGVAVASTDLMAMLPLRVLLKEELQQVCEQLQLEG